VGNGTVFGFSYLRTDLEEQKSTTEAVSSWKE
jgi:hypothetical protein